MAYWIDEGFHSWPEIVRAGTAAAGLYTRCGSYIADHLLDGLVPFEVAALYGSQEWAKRLVDVGLWEIEEHGYRDLRYFGDDAKPLNPTAEKVREKKAANAERQRRWVERQRARRAAKASPNGTANALANAPLTITPTLPPSKEGKGDARPRSAMGGADAPQDQTRPWCGRCHKDTRMDVDDHDRSTPCPRCHPDRNPR